ncbi:hypothetical protein VE03_07714 [Pseudogymnoascus sp. 23342-1-I1]|nr:hypothetical protein VE03_07714 [Pseudogymnoascus sp. 23342-1-I1]
MSGICSTSTRFLGLSTLVLIRRAYITNLEPSLSQSLLGLFHRRFKPSRNNTSLSNTLLSKVLLSNASLSNTSAFAQLPPELVLRIASYLPPTSAGALSLCSKALYTLLSIPYLKCQRGHPAFNVSDFLRLLEPSLPDHIVCYCCGKLHEIKHAGQHVKFDKRCNFKVNEAMRSFIHPSFSHVVFQMVMKRYRQGRDHLSFLDLLSYQDPGSSEGESRVETSCRIVDGSLLVRQQHIFIVHRHNQSRFTLYMKTMICPHAQELYGKIDYRSSGTAIYSMVYTTGGVDVDRSPSVVGCDSCGYQGEKNEGNWSGLVRCRTCATEFRVDSVGVPGARAFVVTRWKDLGEGRDAEDPVWQAHVDKKGLVAGVRRKDGEASICKRFEGKGWKGGIESAGEL